MESFDAGLILYEVDIALNLWLVALLWRSDRKPYFLAYTIFRLIASLVRFPTLLAGGMDMYTRVYWLTSGILVFACVWVLCDFFPKLTVPITVTAMTLSFMQLLHPTVAMERNVQIAMFVACCYVLFRDPKNMVAVGLVIAMLLSGIGEREAIMLGGDISRFLPSLAFLIAQTIWIYGVIKLRHHKVLLEEPLR